MWKSFVKSWYKLSLMKINSKILVLGGRGLVGSAIVRQLGGYEQVFAPERSELDLSIQGDVLSYFERVKPEYVFLAAAKTGGILAQEMKRIRMRYFIFLIIIHH